LKRFNAILSFSPLASGDRAVIAADRSLEKERKTVRANKTVLNSARDRWGVLFQHLRTNRWAGTIKILEVSSAQTSIAPRRFWLIFPLTCAQT